MNGKNIAEIFSKVRAKKPLVCHITNIVTVNDCANITISAGASPVMIYDKREAAEMAAAADALVLNIGTLNGPQVDSMLEAGRSANENGVPVVLDPVGAGATRLRTETVMNLLEKLEIAVLKGNAGEISSITGMEGCVRGVDSVSLCHDLEEIASKCAESFETVVAMSGPEDLITNGNKVLVVQNGHQMMGNLSGTGCMGASLTGAFVSVEDDHLKATSAAFSVFGRAGELAAEKCCGPYSFRTALFDELYNLDGTDLAAHARVKIKYEI